tara:strand:- start:507 stop:1445 length:939 start_codon:yes stop_codon:yes gene_type:complete
MPDTKAQDQQSKTVSQRAFETVLDSIDAAIYVADMQSYDLLFLNAYSRKRWGEAGNRKCWQVLQQGQSGPCSFCTNGRLLDSNGEPREVHIWEFRNTVTQRWYQCRDQAILWPDGRLVRIEIATDITELKDMQAELGAAKLRAEELAYQDELTGLNNRRAFAALSQPTIDQARRSGQPLALIGFDADHFKQVNDCYGHAAGDQVLKSLADTVRSQIRAGDVLARVGGEEFALLLPGTDIAVACDMAERLRKAVEAMTVDYAGKLIKLTCSFGVTASSDGNASLEQLMHFADKATYIAKARQRNCVAVLTLPA